MIMEISYLLKEESTTKSVYLTGNKQREREEEKKKERDLRHIDLFGLQFLKTQGQGQS